MRVRNIGLFAVIFSVFGLYVAQNNNIALALQTHAAMPEWRPKCPFTNVDRNFPILSDEQTQGNDEANDCVVTFTHVCCHYGDLTVTG